MVNCSSVTLFNLQNFIDAQSSCWLRVLFWFNAFLVVMIVEALRNRIPLILATSTLLIIIFLRENGPATMFEQDSFAMGRPVLALIKIKWLGYDWLLNVHGAFGLATDIDFDMLVLLDILNFVFKRVWRIHLEIHDNILTKYIKWKRNKFYIMN